jgi:4-amino-4-deoxy-L-arabinose transferase-like glycosyltransferase
MTLPSRDSGVFLYVGWRFLNGDMPYRDVWDHKPPLIYAVDALGITLTPDSLWGVWFLQFIFVFFTIFFIYRLLDKEFGVYAAVAGVVTLTSGLLTILEKGNVTEEYALVFQALAFLLFVNAWKKDFPIRDSFWIGLIGGLAFNFKQTTIGIWITYGLFLLVIRLFLQRKSPLKDLLSLAAGWLVPSVLLALYLASQNAFADFWDQAFLYNFAYIGKHEGIRRLIPVFMKGFAYLRNGWVLYLAILGWLAGFGYVLLQRKAFTVIHPLILIALVNLPIEILLITISGRSILHYYLTLLPVMAILAGILVYTVPFLISRIPALSSPNLQRRVPALMLLLVLLGQ